MSVIPKIFISYSWTTPKHEDWVVQLAERLASDGIDVVLDKWDLKEGHDKFNFMESMVRSSDIHKVLIILDARYAEKANSRNGGVGTETQIISPKVYADVSQDKFIPIIAEKDSNGDPYLPTYLESRIYIDLSIDAEFEDSYEKLLRNLHKRPAHTKPHIGTPPGYLFEEAPISHKTSSIVRRFEKNLNLETKPANSLLREFLDVYFEELKKYGIPDWRHNDQTAAGMKIIDNLNSYALLRNDFISFIQKITKIEYEVDVDVIISFFENLNLLKRPLENRGSWTVSQFDNFVFIISELFLYVISCALKNENYKLISELIYSKYFLKDNFDRLSDPVDYNEFNRQIGTFDSYYIETFSKNFVSPMADFLIQRVPAEFNKERFIDADLLCHYIGRYNNLHWFPITYIYKQNMYQFELFRRLDSLRHFEKIKDLFNVPNVNVFKERLLELKANEKNRRELQFNYSTNSVPDILRLINIDTVGSLR